VRQSKSQIERFIRNLKKVQKRYWDLSKQALQLGDRVQFRQLAGALMRARDQANTWERYLLMLEAVSLRRDEVSVAGEFLKGIDTVANSILRGATPEQIASMQLKLEKGLARADAMQNTLSLAMEQSSDGIFSEDQLDESKLDELARQIGAEAQADESAGYDQRIADGMKQLEEEMRKEM
jgi:hypothetical protein